MWHLESPKASARAVYELAISKVKDPDVRSKLTDMTDAVELATDTYNSAASAAALHLLKSKEFTPESEDDVAELKKTYTSRMVPVDSPAHPAYDDLILAVERRPLCGHRPVGSLDHHLPKKHFPLLSISPTNLVPACTTCNHRKSSSHPAIAEEQTFHPYFDDAGSSVWLCAEVLESSPPAIIFSASPPDHWSPLFAARALNHFRAYGLARLYAAQAAVELSLIEYSLDIRFQTGGANAVREHLSLESVSRFMVDPNSWQAATYAALAGSSWYCEGGYRI